MGNYTVIADVGQALVKLLRERLCPEVIRSPDNIGLCAPSDRGDMVLGLHLYDIREKRELRANRMRSEGVDQQRWPSLYLSLSYMVTAYSKAEIKFRAVNNQEILGKVIEVFQDESVLSTDRLMPENQGSGLDLHVEMVNPNMEEQRKIWNVSEQAYQTSLFYEISPVELESTRTRRIQRVVDTDLGIKE